MNKQCLQCGGFFIARSAAQRYCTQACVTASRARICSGCGGEYVSNQKAQKYCSAECAIQFSPDRIRVALTACKSCGIEFRPNHNRLTYCSRKCAGAYRTKQAQIRKDAAKRAACTQCGNEFIRTTTSMVCSDVCRNIRLQQQYDAALAKQRDKYRNANNITLHQRACRYCDETFVQDNAYRKVYCSNECGEKQCRRVRKVKQRSATPDKLCIEPFGPWEIYRRDKYTCQICGDKVNLAVHHSHWYAPTLDHIVPISKGGHHVRSNVQTAHRLCNSLKSDKEMPPMFFALNDIPGGGQDLCGTHKENHAVART